jgi:hypothetical protein
VETGFGLEFGGEQFWCAVRQLSFKIDGRKEAQKREPTASFLNLLRLFAAMIWIMNFSGTVSDILCVNCPRHAFYAGRIWHFMSIIGKVKRDNVL